MKTKKLVVIDKKATVKKLFDNGFTNEYENDVIIDALEKCSNELYTRNQVKGFKLFYPTATVKEMDSHSYIITML